MPLYLLVNLPEKFIVFKLSSHFFLISMYHIYNVICHEISIYPNIHMYINHAYIIYIYHA